MSKPGRQAEENVGTRQLIPIGGGKGGVGKTFVTANVATVLARQGLRVVVVDADLEGANLHTLLGVQDPPCSLADFVAQREDDLQKLTVETQIPNLSLIAATHAHIATPQPSQARRVQLLRGLRKLPADVVLMDLGAGIHPPVMDYFMVADHGLLVISPEPTSIENAYSFLRAAFYRRLRLAMASLDVRKLVSSAMDQRGDKNLQTPFDLLREVQAMDPESGARFVQTVRSFRPRLLMNDVQTAEDIRLGFSIRSVCKKYFGIDVEYLGYVNREREARDSVRSRVPLVDFAPESQGAAYLRRVASRLIEPEKK
ncbi:P-loop NTPase [Myxococcota bacterium]|nr:P-loop NTPase [Myxococcota bacterium]